MAASNLKSFWILLPLFLAACSSSPKKISHDQRVDDAIIFIADGRSSKILSDKPKKLTGDDLLKLSTFARYGKKNDLTISSVNYITVEKNITGWEKTTTEKLNGSIAEFIAYSFGGLGNPNKYEPRPYESTMLSFNLALNHSISGHKNLAAIEARKIGEKEDFIERLNVKTLDAIKEQQKIEFNLGPGAKPISKIEMIEDYPVEIFRSQKGATSLKNAYQSAAANFLAGYIFEAEGDLSLAAPAYRKALTLLPKSSLFESSLKNLDTKKNIANTSDVLFVFETGLAPKITTKKYRFDIPTKLGQKFTSISLPVIANPHDRSEILNKVFINQQQLDTELTLDVRRLIIKDLQDSMPKYLTMATTKALFELSSQMSVLYFTRGMQNTDQGLTRLLASGLIAGFYNRRDFDVRSWDSLPESIYMARGQLPYGEHEITFQGNTIPRSIKVEVNQPYQIVNLRMIDRNIFLAQNANNKKNSLYMDEVLQATK
jgi:uncharacterized protein